MPRQNKNDASNPSNQHLIDKLIEISSKPYYASNTNYSLLFNRAIYSIKIHPDPITNREEVKKLKHIGDFCATRLFPIGKSRDKNREPSKKRKKEIDEVQSYGSNSMSSPPSSPSASILSSSSGERRTINNVTAQTTVLSSNPRIPTHEEAEQLLKKLKTSQKWSSLSRNISSEKHSNFLRATQFGEEMVVEEYTNWKVILLLDMRERNGDDVQSKLMQSGIVCEQRTLPIGDMLWITRGESKADSSKTIELLLGTIIERKTANDLASSIFGTRYAEQQLRLKYSATGARQVIYLIESSNMQVDARNCPAKTLRSALAETMLYRNFSILKTTCSSETVKSLKRLHRRIIRRAFPDQCESWSGHLFSPSPGKRRQKDPEQMVFRYPPIPFETLRHYTYEELCTKIYYTRECNTRTVRSIFRAQLKQIDTIDKKKIDVITAKYPVPISLMDDYYNIMKNNNLEAASCLLMNIELQSSSSIRTLRIGPKSSREVAYMYTCKPGEYFMLPDQKVDKISKVKLSRSSSIDSADAFSEASLISCENMNEYFDEYDTMPTINEGEEEEEKMSILQSHTPNIEKEASSNTKRYNASSGSIFNMIENKAQPSISLSSCAYEMKTNDESDDPLDALQLGKTTLSSLIERAGHSVIRTINLSESGASSNDELLSIVDRSEKGKVFVQQSATLASKDTTNIKNGTIMDTLQNNRDKICQDNLNYLMKRTSRMNKSNYISKNRKSMEKQSKLITSVDSQIIDIGDSDNDESGRKALLDCKLMMNTTIDGANETILSDEVVEIL